MALTNAEKQRAFRDRKERELEFLRAYEALSADTIHILNKIILDMLEAQRRPDEP